MVRHTSRTFSSVRGVISGIHPSDGLRAWEEEEGRVRRFLGDGTAELPPSLISAALAVLLRASAPLTSWRCASRFPVSNAPFHIITS